MAKAVTTQSHTETPANGSPLRLEALMTASTRSASPLVAPMVGQPSVLLSDTSLTQLVNEAFRNYHSTLALSRSPLANGALIAPTLLLDEASPTAEERGRGLRLVLQWAVTQIAPGAIHDGLGEFRPFDDPSWSDPRWWRYNILRHRYLEPLHPDDFIDGGRYTETLMALTGITSSDAFFDERNRAIQEVADRLRQQLVDGAANHTLQQMALAEIVGLLQGQPTAAHLLGIAATFDTIFERTILLEMAAAEAIEGTERALHYLITHRLLLSGDGGRSLWISPPLRAYLYQSQGADQLQRRHRLAARYYVAQDAPLTTARHWLAAAQAERAAELLLGAAEGLIHELQVSELIQTLQRFTERELSAASWRELQLLLSDLYYRSGQAEEALTACRRALKVTEGAAHQARIYRRMGKLYVTRNQLHALGYYQQAAERFTNDDPEFAHLLKDRGWLYILQRNWGAAETDLLLARSLTKADELELRADIVDALASLYLRQGNYTAALTHAQQALTMREEQGALPRIASSFNNLGIIYRRLGEHWQAISAYEEALVTYRKLGNHEATAGALLNIGSAFYFLGHYTDAIDHYIQSLTLCQKLAHPHVEVTVRYNLAEAYAALAQSTEANHHWQQGYELSKQAGFADEVQAFEGLRATLPRLQAAAPVTSQPTPAMPDGTPRANEYAPSLPQEERAILELAKRYGQITAKLVVDQLNVSRATATRRLTSMAEAGQLRLQGKGRGVYYELASPAAAPVMAGTPATTEPSTPSAIESGHPCEQLRAAQLSLQQHFGVTGLALTPGTHPSAPVAIVVRYAQEPSLAAYWALKRHLATLLGHAIELLPESELANSEPTLQAAVQWLWLQQSESPTLCYNAASNHQCSS